MSVNTTSAALIGAALALLPATPAIASSGSEAATASGCVSNAAYGRLSVGQRLSYVRRAAGDSAQISMRRWTDGSNAFQQRHYRMCTPTDAAHRVLTTRFTYYRGAWRAQIVDTMVGPEPN